MPGQEISQPNPPPGASLLSDDVLFQSVQLKTENYLPPDELKAVQAFRRAADYVAAGKLSIIVACSTCLSSSNVAPSASHDLLEGQRPGRA